MSNSLAQYKKTVTSQWGEDGIIEEIFNRIGTKNKYCVEFGAGNGTELSNVWNLISSGGWKGALIEPNPVSVEKWQETIKPFKNKVKLIQEFVSLEKEKTLDDILRDNSVPFDIDLVSIDIDSNDYHIFKSLNWLKPRVILLEHNPTIPPHVDVFQKYNEVPSFGSSLAANVRLAHEKGYKLAAATVTNGFYVRADEFSKLNIEEVSPRDAFDNEALTYIVSAYNGTLYSVSKQSDPSYTRLFNSSNFAFTKKTTHSLTVGVGYNQREFSETLTKVCSPVKIFKDGKNNTTGLAGFLRNIFSFVIKPYFSKNK